MVILAIEIALLCVGISAFVTGRFWLSPNRVVQGGVVRVLGLIAILPILAAFFAGYGVGINGALRGEDLADQESQPIFIAIEVGSVFFCAVVILAMGWFATRMSAKEVEIQAEPAAEVSWTLPDEPSEGPPQEYERHGTVPLRTAGLTPYLQTKPAAAPVPTALVPEPSEEPQQQYLREATVPLRTMGITPYPATKLKEIAPRKPVKRLLGALSWLAFGLMAAFIIGSLYFAFTWWR